MHAVLQHLQWPNYAGIGILTFVITVIAFVRTTARLGRHHKLEVFEHLAGAGAEELVLLVPGYTRGPSDMRKVREIVREVRPTADVLILDYNRFTFSNADPFRIAERIDEEIDARYSNRNYRRITLLGYSMGALLIRKAYVYGCGSVADAPTAGGSAAAYRQPKDWVKVGPRFVLLAGMNRGWNPDYRHTQTGWFHRTAFRFGLFVAKYTHTGLLVRQAMRGEPFVANLRLQWLEVMRTADAKGIKRPRVIQLLGDQDDVVSKDDSRDVTVARDFVWVTVNNTGHYNVCDVGDSGIALERKRKIQLAFGDEAAIDILKRTNCVLASNEDTAVRTVVFVLHGIRDMGEWTSEFEDPLQKAYRDKYPDGGKLYVHRASYGYFGMGPFLLFGDRQKNVRWFMDQVTELTARFANMQEIHFIGHSNGTYVLASALDKYNTLKVKQVVLAGSVIRRDFGWSGFAGRVNQVRNYVGAKDLVVGLLPRLFELPGFGMLNRDIGSAGFNGFEDGFVRPMQTEFIKGGHAAALVSENVSSIVDFVINGVKKDNPDIFAPTRPGWMQLVSNVCWFVWLIGVALIVALIWHAPTLGMPIVHLLGWHPQSTLLVNWSFRIVLVLFLWLIMLTI
jgi:pimeloyl-ACP methyl ester carboxylesterase